MEQVNKSKLRLYIALAIVFSLLVMLGFKMYNLAVLASNSEVDARAAHSQARNVLGQLAPKLKELAQVQSMSIEDQVRLTEAVFGEDGRAGNQAAWQWIKEQNPTADVSIRKQMAQIVEGTRNDFKSSQDLIIALCQEYNRVLVHPIDGSLLSWLGYPDKKRKLEEFTYKEVCRPVVSSHAHQAASTGIDDGIDLK